MTAVIVARMLMAAAERGLEQRARGSGHRVLCIELLGFLLRNGVGEAENVGAYY